MPKPPVLQETEAETTQKLASLDTDAYVAQIYSSFLTTYQVWQMQLPILGGRTPLEFWNNSTRDYAVLAQYVDDPNDPVEQYQSTISRDKTNTIYANLASKFFYPSCVAVNNEQSIDRTFGKVGDAGLYWAYKQDGWPSESGQQKNARIVHKCCVQGTAYTLDVVTSDGLDSEMMPNEEVFYRNMWQPNIQKQKQVFRAVLNMSVGEAEEAFGEYDNWDQVDTTGGWTSTFQIQYPDLKGIFDGIVQSDKVSVLYVWTRATQKELVQLKRKGKVYQNAKRAWYYNVIVNNVPMFPVDNVCPYKSGILPISKLIFEPMAETEFCLGNSVPNKCQEDKRWKDAWKTNIRYRGKLAAMPPQLVIGGHLDGDEVMIPAKFTDVPRDVEVKAVPGVIPVSQADIELMNMVDADIASSTIEPVPSSNNSPARTSMILQAQAQQMMEPFSQQLAFFAASRSFHIITALMQYVPKSKLAKLVVPDQTLDDGLTGTFEVIFKDPVDIVNSEVKQADVDKQMEGLKAAGVEVDEAHLRRLMHSATMKKTRDHSRMAGEPRDTIYVSPSYVQDFKFYLFADAQDGLQDKDAMAQAKFQQDLPLLLSNPQFIVPQEVWREYIRMRGYNERLLQKNPATAMPPQVPGQGQSQGNPMAGDLPTPPAPGTNGQAPPSTPNQLANAAAVATTGAPIGNLPGV